MVSGKRAATSNTKSPSAKSRAKTSNTNLNSSSNQQTSSTSTRREVIGTSSHSSAPPSSSTPSSSTTSQQEQAVIDTNFKKVQIWGNRHYHNHPMIFVKRMGKTVNFSGFSALFTASRIIHEYMRLENNVEELRNFINKIESEELSSNQEGEEINEEEDGNEVVLHGGSMSDGSR